MAVRSRAVDQNILQSGRIVPGVSLTRAHAEASSASSSRLADNLAWRRVRQLLARERKPGASDIRLWTSQVRARQALKKISEFEHAASTWAMPREMLLCLTAGEIKVLNQVGARFGRQLTL